MFQASVSDCSNPILCRCLRLHFYLALLPHNFFYLFLDRSFRLSLPPELPPIELHISFVDTDSLSLCTRFSPPILPGSGATVHLEGAPACQPPPLVCAFLPLGSPRSSLREPVSTFPCQVALPFTSLTCAIRSLSAPGFSCTGAYSSICLPSPSARLPAPLSSSTIGPVPCRSQVVASCSLYPCPLRIRLSLPVFRSVSWCRLKFNSSLGVLLCGNLRPGRLHSLVITCPIPCPCATQFIVCCVFWSLGCVLLTELCMWWGSNLSQGLLQP